jgi:hypothetical protein
MDQVRNPDKSCTIPQSKAYKAVIKAHYEYTALSQEGIKVYEAKASNYINNVQTNSEILCLVPLSPSMFSAKPQPSPLSM